MTQIQIVKKKQWFLWIKVYNNVTRFRPKRVKSNDSWRAGG